MRIKKFRGENILGLLNKIKAELGEEAVILDTEHIKTEKGYIYEVTAAIDEEEVNLKNSFTNEENSQKYIIKEIIEIKNMLSKLLNSQLKEKTYIELIEREIPPFIAEEFNNCEDIYKFVWGRLKEKEKDADFKYQMFIGEAGVGKTINIFKLATLYKYRYNAKVLVINLDDYKIGSNFQAKRIAQLLDVDFKTLNFEEFKEINLNSFNYDFILIDTPSLGKRLLIKDLEDITFKFPFLGFQWVIRATDHYYYILRVWEEIKRLPIIGIFLTFVDKVFDKVLLWWILNSEFPPVTFISNGERIPEDIIRGDKKMLAKLLLKDLSIHFPQRVSCEV